MNIVKMFQNKINTFHRIRFNSCWSCGHQIEKIKSNLFCSGCKALQEPNKCDNYFQILGVTESFDINEGDLSKRFKDLQKYLHPDKFASRGQREQQISEKYSSLVNEAYKTLLEPLSRGIYMLKLKGEEISESTQVDNKFLMEIMEKNEEVENAESEDEILKLNLEISTIIKDLQGQVSKAFFEGDMKRVTGLLSHMKYYTSIDSQIQAAIRNKGIIR